MNVYGFLYNDCIYESSFSTKSVHKTKLGAYKAMNFYLNKIFIRYREESLLYGKREIYDHIFEGTAHRIETIKVLD